MSDVAVICSDAALAATEAALGGQPVATDDGDVLKQIVIVAANLITPA